MSVGHYEKVVVTIREFDGSRRDYHWTNGTICLDGDTLVIHHENGVKLLPAGRWADAMGVDPIHPTYPQLNPDGSFPKPDPPEMYGGNTPIVDLGAGPELHFEEPHQHPILPTTPTLKCPQCGGEWIAYSPQNIPFHNVPASRLRVLCPGSGVMVKASFHHEIPEPQKGVGNPLPEVCRADGCGVRLPAGVTHCDRHGGQ